ncbi:predicted protein [Naegleria gruberi]|uniref:Predicted protein n=1 Tax=Naegleria gruberi TaxID=5762 RepID=D2VMF9_NAEGR|nr:uncharacterized protein NAEGRDRAFT_70119 [Naegleria gruberi]EFC42055.1 predicted protein [Naegleria gruberi]|eukprot:XP_002674799.1 predicted protein [Naegleria gruberi strain NEG-M]
MSQHYFRENITIALIGDHSDHSERFYRYFKLYNFTWRRTINYNVMNDPNSMNDDDVDRKLIIQLVGIGARQCTITNMNKALMVSDYAIIIVESTDDEIMYQRLRDCIRMVNYSLIDRILLLVDNNRNVKSNDQVYDWIRKVIRKESVVELTCEFLNWNSIDKVKDWIHSLPIKIDFDRLAAQPVRIQMLQTVYSCRLYATCHFKVLSGIVHQGEEIYFNTNNGERKFKVEGADYLATFSYEKPKVFLPGNIFFAPFMKELIPRSYSHKYKHFLSGNYYSEKIKMIKVDSFWIDYTHFNSDNINKDIYINQTCWIFCKSKLFGKIERIQGSGNKLRIGIKISHRFQTGHDSLMSQNGFLTTFERDPQFGRVLLARTRREMFGFGNVVSVVYQDKNTNALLIQHPISLFSKIPKHNYDIYF